MGRIVIACYRPKAGKKEALKRLILDHVATLRSEGLVTDREPITMEAEDGTVVEVFEWASADAIESAHINATVLKMWDQYTAVCDYIPVAEVAEAAKMFSEFTPIAGVRRTLSADTTKSFGHKPAAARADSKPEPRKTGPHKVVATTPQKTGSHKVVAATHKTGSHRTTGAHRTTGSHATRPKGR
jgi:hypothetical protein